LVTRPIPVFFVNYAQLLAPDFCLIVCGWLLCRFTALNRPLWQQVETLVYYLLFPVLLLHSILKSPLRVSEAAGLIAAATGAGLCAVALAYSLPRLPWLARKIDLRDHAAGAQIAFRFNSFIVLALAERLAGAQGLLMISILIGVCVPLVNIAAVWPMMREAPHGFVHELVRNPLIVATAAGLAGNMLGLHHLPSWLEPAIERIGAASLALGLMAAGAGLQLELLARGKRLSVALLVIRHAVQPLVAWVLARLLALDTVQTTVLMVFCAAPTASSCYVLAVRMGYNGPYVAGLVTLSTLLGAISLPLALGLVA